VLSLAHPYGENNDSHTVFCELKKHALAFTGDSHLMIHCHNTLMQYKVQESSVVLCSM
jgi:hypothetical protein